MKQKFIIILFSSFIFYMTGFIRQYSFLLDFYLTPIFYFFLIIALYYYLKKDIQVLFFYTCFGLLLINIIAFFVDGNPSEIMYRNLTAYFWGIVLACALLYVKSSSVKIIILVIYIFFISIYSIVLNKYVENYVNSGSLSGVKNISIKGKLCAININKDTIFFNSDKIYVLDFWFRGCAPCFRAFPKFDELYNTYKTNSNMVIYSVNIPVAGDSNQIAFEIMAKYNYSFPTLIGLNNIDSMLGIRSFPQVFILRNNIIEFIGSIELASNYLEQLQ